jgi:hypothetical protein
MSEFKRNLVLIEERKNINTQNNMSSIDNEKSQGTHQYELSREEVTKPQVLNI